MQEREASCDGKANAVGRLKECRPVSKEHGVDGGVKQSIRHSLGRPRDVAPADRHEDGTLAGTCVLALGIVSSELGA
ncbi:hypothetical protein IG631_03555 [Alternaria alternata]|nr:hypothetical protein IG631_03555 [Alternaria alternata]